MGSITKFFLYITKITLETLTFVTRRKKSFAEQILVFSMKNKIIHRDIYEVEFLNRYISVADDGMPTPTLKQLYQTIRQMQFDLQDVKSQLNQERTLRGNLQQLIISHIEKCSGSGA